MALRRPPDSLLPSASHPLNRPHGTLSRALCCAVLLSAPTALSAQEPTLPSDQATAILESAPAARAATADSIIAIARAQVGRRYLWGGNEPERGFDCSGFTRYLMRALRVALPRTADEQARVGEAVPRDPRFLRIGDLLTFGTPTRISHIGVYIGGGRYVHASSTAGRVVESRLDRPGSTLLRAWQGVRRVISGRDSTVVAGG